MKSLRLATAAAAILVAAPLLAPASAEGLKAVAFDIEAVELPQTPKIKDNLKRASDLVKTTLEQRGFAVVDTTPQAKKIADNTPLSQCNGCDQDIAQALGADIEVTTAAQRISAVTYSLSGNIKDVKTNRVLRQGAVDIRGESPDEWNHGIRFLIKDRLLDPPLPADQKGLAALVASKPAGQ